VRCQVRAMANDSDSARLASKMKRHLLRLPAGPRAIFAFLTTISLFCVLLSFSAGALGPRHRNAYAKQASPRMPRLASLSAYERSDDSVIARRDSSRLHAVSDASAEVDESADLSDEGISSEQSSAVESARNGIADGGRNDKVTVVLPQKRMLVQKGYIVTQSPRTKAAVEGVLEATNAAVEKSQGYIESLRRNTQTSAYRQNSFDITVDLEAKRDEDGERLMISLVVRVPVEHFQELFDACKNLPQATLKDERLDVEDVTSKFVDVAARAASLQATHDQMVELMKRAEKISDVLDIQKHLTGIRQDLEAKKQQQRWLEKEASLSTLSIKIEEALPVPKGRAPTIVPEQTWRVIKTVGNALGIWANLLADMLDCSIYLLLFGVPAFGCFACVYRIQSSFLDKAESALTGHAGTSAVEADEDASGRHQA